jgi:hypothetical protein|tara:strand:+ start:658 stop:1080 length:423 start_codon:yes stop_codon:yes gene_type:complete
MNEVMDIKHPSIFKTDVMCEIYSKRDGVPIKYVCTTDLNVSDIPADIYYRETPHPEFGNRYFGVYYDPRTKNAMITSADVVEEHEFGMIKSANNEWYYSSSHHDCIFIEDKMIDGGRQYIRSTGLDGVFKIVNGEFVNVE